MTDTSFQVTLAGSVTICEPQSTYGRVLPVQWMAAKALMHHVCVHVRYRSTVHSATTGDTMTAFEYAASMRVWLSSTPFLSPTVISVSVGNAWSMNVCVSMSPKLAVYPSELPALHTLIKHVKHMKHVACSACATTTPGVVVSGAWLGRLCACESHQQGSASAGAPEDVLLGSLAAPPVRSRRLAIIVEAGHAEATVIQDRDVAGHLHRSAAGSESVRLTLPPKRLQAVSRP